MKDTLYDNQVFATKELESCEPEDKPDCEKCNDTGVVEIMGGTEYDEWTVVDEKICDCVMD